MIFFLFKLVIILTNETLWNLCLYEDVLKKENKHYFWKIKFILQMNYMIKMLLALYGHFLHDMICFLYDTCRTLFSYRKHYHALKIKVYQERQKHWKKKNKYKFLADRIIHPKKIKVFIRKELNATYAET